MGKYGVSYTLKKGEEEYTFEKLQDAAMFLNGCESGILKRYNDGKTYKGFTVIRNGGNYHHEAHKNRLYKIWSGMKERCYRKKHTHYRDYGGRGITVCEEWKNDYVTFRDWALKNGYRDDLTLDRIDVNGNYEPSNCRWISKKEQFKNTRRNRVLEYKGEKAILRDMARKYGIKPTTLKERLNDGMSVEEAIETPVRFVRKIVVADIEITANGETHTIREWSEITGLKLGVLKNRYQRGWDGDRIINQPYNSKPRPKS